METCEGYIPQLQRGTVITSNGVPSISLVTSDTSHNQFTSE